MTDLFPIPSTPEPRLTTARKRLERAMDAVEDYSDGDLGIPYTLHYELYEARVELECAERERLNL